MDRLPLPLSSGAEGGESASTEEDDGTTQTAKLDEDQLLERIKRWFKDDDQVAKKWREEAEQDYDFVAGHQWSEDDRAWALERKLHPITYDRLGPIVDTVCGLEVNNREEASLKPRSKTDGIAADCGTDLLEWIRDEADAEDEESDAFRDVVIGGMGWAEHYIDEVDEAQIQIRRTDPFEMRWDGSAKRRNLEDAKHVERCRDIALDEARAMFSGFNDADLHAGWAVGSEPDSPVDRERARDYASDNNLADQEVRKRGRVTVVECQWKEVVAEATVTDPTMGETITLPEDQALTLGERMAELGVAVQLGSTKRRTIVKQAFVGNKLLKVQELAIQGEGFSYKPLTGKWDRKKGIFYGIIRGARDPQRYANKFLQQTAHILATTANNGVLFEEGAFADPVDAEEKWAENGTFVEAAPGMLDKIRPRFSDKGLPTGFENVLQFSLQSIRDATGINLELTGLADRQQAGILETQRKQAGVTILAVFFDNLRRFRKASTRYVLKMAIELLPVEQLLRAVGEERGDALKLLLAPGAPVYDVVIEEAPTSINAKERAWAAIFPLMEYIMANASPKIKAAVVRASPLPSDMAEEIAVELEKPPTPEQQQKQQAQEQLAMAGAQAEVADKQAAAFQKQTAGQLNLAKIQGEQADAAAAIIEAQTPDIHVMSPPRLPNRPQPRQ